jgi:catechol 2,3-dioxygenase-like lactoylglutathione lyase family enzyme
MAQRLRHRRGSLIVTPRASIERAFGYQGDNMNLPVPDLEAALPFYERVLGFRVMSRAEAPHKSTTLGRDKVQMRLAENEVGTTGKPNVVLLWRRRSRRDPGAAD